MSRPLQRSDLERYGIEEEEEVMTAAGAHRVGAVDIGSNTLHMVVMDVTDDYALHVVDRQVELVQLGADVATTGAIGAERAARAEATLTQMAAHARDLGTVATLALATEGVRAASNAEAMLARFSAAWGAPIALISGMEEAVLTFWGATSGEADPTRRLGVGDLGGGSCELVLGTRDHIAFATSLPLGSNRLLAEVNPADPPTADDFARLRAAADAALTVLTSPAPPLDHIIGVGGTATALGRILGSPDGLTLADLQRGEELLASAPAAALSQQVRADPARVRLVVAGIAAWGAILARVGATTMRTSENGVREGAIIAWAHAGDGWRDYTQAAVAQLEKPSI
jgi:exopolyphosphatase/guanosine-5'-triphosphate,3'-diphosphate pyrophosphatase